MYLWVPEFQLVRVCRSVPVYLWVPEYRLGRVCLWVPEFPEVRLCREVHLYREARVSEPACSRCRDLVQAATDQSQT